MRDEQIIAGEWIFSPDIAVEALIEVARKMRDFEPDRYLSIHVRQWNGETRQNCISFIYRFSTKSNARKTQDHFFHSTREKLQKQFGVKNVRWNMSSPVVVIAAKDSALFTGHNVTYLGKKRTVHEGNPRMIYEDERVTITGEGYWCVIAGKGEDGIRFSLQDLVGGEPSIMISPEKFVFRQVGNNRMDIMKRGETPW